jgi:hypothetical protein
MKMLPVGAELFRADDRADVAKLIVTIRNFANALSNVSGACNTIFVLTVMFRLVIIGQYHLYLFEDLFVLFIYVRDIKSI